MLVPIITPYEYSQNKRIHYKESHIKTKHFRGVIYSLLIIYNVLSSLKAAVERTNTTAPVDLLNPSHTQQGYPGFS